MCDVREGGCVVRYYLEILQLFRCAWSSLISRDFFLVPPGDFAAAPFQPGTLGFTSPALGRGEMRLTILSLQTGARELTDVTADETVSALKTKLYESNLIDVQPTGQRLIFSGRTLGDGEKLATDAESPTGTSWSW